MSTRSLTRKELLVPLYRHVTTVTQPLFQSQQRFVHPIYDHLEKQNKQVLPEETGVWVFPDERPGNEYATNWSLARHHIHPCFDSYRNADYSHIYKTAPYGRVDGKKYLIADEYKATSFDNFVSTRYESETVSKQQELAVRYHRRVAREIAYYLTHVYNSFVHDGSIGGFRSSQSLVRFVTDNSLSALFLKNMLHPVPLRNAFDYKPESVVLHAPGFRLTPPEVVEEFAGPSAEDLGINREEFLMVNQKSNQIILSGITDTDVILSTLAYTAGKLAFEKNALLLPSDSLITNDGQVTLIVHANGKSLINNTSDDYTLYGAHHNVWSAEGLSRAWVGSRTTVSSLKDENVRDEDLVEKVNGGYRITRGTSSKHGDQVLPSLVNHPKIVILAIHDPNYLVPAIAQIDANQLRTLYSTGLKSISKEKPTFSQALVDSEHFAPYANPNQITDRFIDLVSQSGAKLYVMNSAHDAKDVANVLKIVNSGASLTTNEKRKNSLWTGLSHDKIKEREWREEEKYTSSMEALVSKVQEQAKKLPSVNPAQ